MGTPLLLGTGTFGGVAAAPVNTVAPVISGTNVVGNLLSTTNGTWTGSPAPTFTYWWKRNGVPVVPVPTPGATTYNLTQLDAGLNITCEVYATNPSGTASATSNSIYVYDVDAQAFITATGITDTTQKNAVNQLTIDLKFYNIWTKVLALYPFIGGTASTHKYNLKNPLDTNSAFRLQFFGGWTHSSNGALPNGTAYANTFINSSSNLTLNSTHLSYYSRTADATPSSMEMGNIISSNSLILGCGFGNVAYSDQYNYNTARISQANTNAQGFYVGTRTTSAIHKLFKNGSQFGSTNTGASGTFNNLVIYLGASNNNGVAATYSSKQCAFSSVGSGLSDTEASNFRTAVQAFNTTLGRQV